MALRSTGIRTKRRHTAWQRRSFGTSECLKNFFVKFRSNKLHLSLTGLTRVGRVPWHAGSGRPSERFVAPRSMQPRDDVGLKQSITLTEWLSSVVTLLDDVASQSGRWVRIRQTVEHKSEPLSDGAINAVWKYWNVYQTERHWLWGFRNRSRTCHDIEKELVKFGERKINSISDTLEQNYNFIDEYLMLKDDGNTIFVF